MNEFSFFVIDSYFMYSLKQDKSKGFAFVEFDLEEDAADALDNMDGSELFGRVLHCNIARQPPKIEHGKAVWTAEEWIQNTFSEQPEQDDSELLADLNPKD